MNRTNLFRTLSLGFATLSIATASVAADDAQLQAARTLAAADAHVATQLQIWIDQRDIALLAQADGLITHDMRASAAEYAVAELVEADGLISAQLRERLDYQMAARLAAADGLRVEGADYALDAPAQPAPRAAVVVASKTTAGR